MHRRRSDRGALHAVVVALFALLLVAAGTVQADFLLPPEFGDRVEVLATFDSRQVVIPTERAVYAEQQGVATTLIGNALLPEGKGGVYEGKVVRVKEPLALYRVYSAREFARSGRGRVGGWWTPLPPARGVSRPEYRRRYEICESFNPDLDRVVACRIYPGALLVVGPGQSVDEQTCGRTGESYAADGDKRYPQIYLFEAFRHQFVMGDERTPLQDTELYLGCPAAADDRSFDWYAGEREAAR